jgi:hypothetical protein
MMAIDTSIYGNIQQPQIENPLNALAKVSQVKAMQNQNQLAQLALADKQREAAGDNALASLIAGGGDSTAIAKGLAEKGYGAKSLAFTKQAAEMAKQQREAEKARLEHVAQSIQLQGQLLGGVRDQATWEQALQVAQQNGMDVSKFPQQYDPAFVQSAKARALTAAQQVDQEYKQKGFDLDVAKFGYQQQNDAANRGVTIRGQNLSDARARDLNEIKRSDKQQAADQARAGQIASFDTMLGTLDRLSKHPGLHRSVGVMGVFPTSPGSDSANFQAELNTFQSQAFVPMVAQLKGMGALSDAEGKKLTAAVGALDPKMGEKAFRESITRITKEMQAAKERVSGAKGSSPESAASGIIDFGSLK